MPNWVYNKIKVKGNASDLISLINLALRNSNAVEVNNDGKVATVAKAVELLNEKGMFRCGDKELFSKEPAHIKEEKGIRLSTFLPIPDTFLKFDTTNYEKEFADEARSQKKAYGVVGWYDYNCKYFGCKWDSDISVEYNGKRTITLTTDTPWSPPSQFLVRLHKMFPNLDISGSSLDECDDKPIKYKVEDLMKIA